MVVGQFGYAEDESRGILFGQAVERTERVQLSEAPPAVWSRVCREVRPGPPGTIG